MKTRGEEVETDKWREKKMPGVCDGEGTGRGSGNEEDRLWEWEINNAINNLGRSHLSSRRRQLVREMNGLSLSSLCPWLRALKLAPSHSHTNGRRRERKKKVFLPFLMSLQSPPPTANTQTHTRGSQTLFESVHPLKLKRHAEAKEGSWRCAWECRRANTHTHTYIYIYTKKLSNPLIRRSHMPLNLCVSLSPTLRISICLSGLQVCCCGFHPRSILFSFDTIFAHSSIGSAASYHTVRCVCVCVCACVLWLFVLLALCGWNRSTALSNILFVYQITNSYSACRNSLKHIVKSVQMLSLFVCLPGMFYSWQQGHNSPWEWVKRVPLMFVPALIFFFFFKLFLFSYFAKRCLPIVRLKPESHWSERNVFIKLKCSCCCTRTASLLSSLWTFCPGLHFSDYELPWPQCLNYTMALSGRYYVVCTCDLRLLFSYLLDALNVCVCVCVCVYLKHSQQTYSYMIQSGPGLVGWFVGWLWISMFCDIGLAFIE